MKIAFIGLGIMGSRMASNLLKNGVDLIVYNRSKSVVEELVKKGAKSGKSPEDAVKEADIVITMLSTPQVVADIMWAKHFTLDNMKAGSIWLDCSTVNPSFSLHAAEKAKAFQVQFLDAPVAGTKPHAENAELVFFVGGEKGLFDKVETYLGYMAKKVMHLGEIGQGASFKMLVNGMLAQSMVIFSEAVIMGEKMGFGREFLLNVLPNLVVSAPFTKVKAKNIQENNYDVQFPLEWMYKDLHLASQTAYELSQPMYLLNMTKEIFAKARQDGFGREDFAAVFKHLES